jgi:AhpD family alkylhydroperoxidase
VDQFLPSLQAMITTQPHTRFSMAESVPDFYKAMIRLDHSVKLEPALHELVKVRASQINGCAYCVDMHSRDARKGGETERRVMAVTAWRESPFFTDRERAALAVCDAITLLPRAGLPDEIYEAAREQFDEEELAELIGACVVINAWNRVAVSTHIVPEA